MLPNTPETYTDSQIPDDNTKESQPKRSHRNGSTNGFTQSVFIKGCIDKVSYRNADGTFGVIRIALSSDSESPFDSDNTHATIVGPVADSLDVGCSIIARGEWSVHHKYGKRFKAWSIVETPPTTENTIIAYLSSGIVKGFGPVLAERVVKAFGTDTLRVLDEEIDRLKEVSGIGKKKLKEIRASWKEKKALREVMLFFQTYNIPMGLINRIYSAYGERSIEKVKTNPYMLAKDLWGVGFLTADRIAIALGVEPNSPFRIRAAVEYSLKRATDDGHCFLPSEKLIAKVESLIQLSCTPEIAQAIEASAKDAEIVKENENVYLPHLHRAECQLAGLIAERIKDSNQQAELNSDLIESFILKRTVVGEGQLQKAIRLSEQQQQAVRLAATKPLVIVTGGPGCGKTTVVRTIFSLFRAASLTVKLAAPTGRAAQRLAEVCSSEASTIHRLLKFDPTTRTFIHDEHDKMPLDAIIVDESSMIDLMLAASLFKALPLKTKVIIVGDADQLPSVGPGRFLADILSVSKVPRVALTTLFRRAEESAITHIAHQINSSLIPHIPEPDGVTKTDAYFLPCADPLEAASLVERLVVEQIPKKFGFKNDQITVLSPMNNGELGIVNLNKRLQGKIVPIYGDAPHVSVGNLDFRLGDRVIQRSNNYNIIDGGVFNGDQGSIIGIDTVKESLIVKLWDGREVEYTSSAINQLDLAYAITIHRAQGAEIPAVVLVLHDSHNILLERQLVYTGITRAKKLLVIVGTKHALSLAVKRTRSSKRHTALISRITEELA